MVGRLIGMLRYAITGEDVSPRGSQTPAASVDFVQLRAAGMDAGEMLALARAMQGALGNAKLLIGGGRVDVALACGAAGVHLTSRPGELSPQQVRQLMPGSLVSVSCHTLREVARARDNDADLILFAPVFEKRVRGEVVAPGVGLDALRAACAVAPAKVLALGGVTQQNAAACLEAGAAGIAGIRMFA